MKHTQGKYKATGLEIRHENRGIILANIYPHLAANQSREEAEANAILMAAAPELLEALEATRQFIIDNMDKLPNSEAIRIQGLKAINHATGEVRK